MAFSGSQTNIDKLANQWKSDVGSMVSCFCLSVASFVAFLCVLAAY